MLLPTDRAMASVSMWPPLLTVVGAGSRSRVHAHHALHVLLAKSGSIRVEDEAGGVRTTSGVITGADVPHGIDALGRDVILVFVEPESTAGARLAASLRKPVTTLPARLRDELLQTLGPPPSEQETLRTWTDRLIDLLAGDRSPAPRMHPRVRRLLAMLRTMPADGDTSLPALSAQVGLSPGRLMHVFTESVGLPLRPYLLWLKLKRAAGAIVSGHSLAAAAEIAGFSDAAHMTRTFQQQFGLPPSALQRSQPVPSRRTPTATSP